MDLQAYQSTYVSASCVAEFTVDEIWDMYQNNVTKVYQDTTQSNGETYTWKFEFVSSWVKDFGGALDCNVSLVKSNSKLLPIHPLVVVRKIFRTNQGIELGEKYRSLKRKPVGVGDTLQFPNVFLNIYDMELTVSGDGLNVIEFTVMVHYEDKTKLVEVLPSRLVLPMNGEQRLSSNGKNAGSQHQASSYQTEYPNGSYDVSSNVGSSMQQKSSGSAPPSRDVKKKVFNPNMPKIVPTKPRALCKDADKSISPLQMKHPGVYSAILNSRPEMQHTVGTSTATRSNDFSQYSVSTTRGSQNVNFPYQVETNHYPALNGQNLGWSRNAYFSSNHFANPNGSTELQYSSQERSAFRNDQSSVSESVSADRVEAALMSFLDTL